MHTQVWLYWFPVVLAACGASALLGRRRGVVVAGVGAAYWLILSTDAGALRSAASAAGTFVAAASIVWLARWVATSRQIGTASARTAPQSAPTRDSAAPGHCPADIIHQFMDWFTEHHDRPDPWPEFGEFVRAALYAASGARHVRAYRVLRDDDQLYPLRITEPEERDFPIARAGLIGHVVTTGKSYRFHDPAKGDLVSQLAAESDAECSWCFAVRSERQTIGVVRVGRLDAPSAVDQPWLQTLEAVVGLCWTTLAECCRGRIAGATDPVSGVLTNEAFIDLATQSLHDSYEAGEPVVLLHACVEGLRALRDSGQWDRANSALYEISRLLKRRVRQDDQIGVFDGSSFLVLFRRVDSQLAALIIRQLIAHLDEICADVDRWGARLAIRCGVAGSGTAQPTLRSLIGRATANSREARRHGVPVASDIETKPAPPAARQHETKSP